MTTPTTMTFEEFELLPDEGKRELIDGEIVTMPPPELNHTEIMIRIFDVLRAALPKRRVWPDRTGYRIAKGWIEPDVSISWPEQRKDAKYFVGSPMIAIEILSPQEQIERKLTLYFAEGAAEVWVLDPEYKALTVYSQQAGVVIRSVIEEEYHSPNLELTVSLTSIFPGEEE